MSEKQQQQKFAFGYCFFYEKKRYQCSVAIKGRSTWSLDLGNVTQEVWKYLSSPLPSFQRKEKKTQRTPLTSPKSVARHRALVSCLGTGKISTPNLIQGKPNQALRKPFWKGLSLTLRWLILRITTGKEVIPKLFALRGISSLGSPPQDRTIFKT